MLSHHTEAYDVAVANAGRHHVYLPRRVDGGQQLLVQLVYLLARLLLAAYEAEAD